MNFYETITAGKEIRTGSVFDAAAWLESFPLTGTRICGIWSNNHLTTENQKLGYFGRVSYRPTSRVFPQGIYRESYRIYCLGIVWANSVDKGREKAAIEVADAMGLDPAEIEVDSFIPQGLWKGHGKRYSNYTVIHDTKRTLYFRGRTAMDENTGEPKILMSEWRDASNDAIISLEDCVEFMPERHGSFTEIEVGGARVEVAKPFFRCQSFEGVRGIVYNNNAFIIEQPLPIPPVAQLPPQKDFICKPHNKRGFDVRSIGARKRSKSVGKLFNCT